MEQPVRLCLAGGAGAGAGVGAGAGWQLRNDAVAGRLVGLKTKSVGEMRRWRTGTLQIDVVMGQRGNRGALEAGGLFGT